VSIFDDLARRNSPTVKAALQEKCPVCKAIPGEDCTNLPINGHPLQGRIVHYMRATGS
jgi:hypothetical protein